GRPIASRVRVEVRFAIPEFDLPPEPIEPDVEPLDEAPPEPARQEAEEDVAEPPAEPQAPPPEPTEPEPAEPEPTEPGLGVEASVDREAAEPARTSSEHTLDRDLLEASPRRDAGDLLQSVPGLFAARGEGDAVGHH